VLQMLGIYDCIHNYTSTPSLHNTNKERRCAYIHIFSCKFKHRHRKKNCLKLSRVVLNKLQKLVPWSGCKALIFHYIVAFSYVSSSWPNHGPRSTCSSELLVGRWGRSVTSASFLQSSSSFSPWWECSCLEICINQTISTQNLTWY